MALTVCRVCGRQVASSLPSCPVCDSPLSGDVPERERSIGLRLPWGLEPIADRSRLALGTDPGFSAIATRLAVFEGVAGQHVEVARLKGNLYVRSLAEATTVRGVALPPGSASRLHGGDTLTIGDLSILVEA